MTAAEGAALPLLEFWPDYGAGPLWRGGVAADLQTLGIPATLVERLQAFNAAYDEQRLPIDGDGDAAFVAEGARLFAEVRAALAGRYRVTVTEP